MKEGLILLGALIEKVPTHIPHILLDTAPLDLATREGALMFSIPAFTVAAIGTIVLATKLLKKRPNNPH